MFNKMIKMTALLLGLTTSTAAFAGGNTTPNAPTTVPAAVVASILSANGGNPGAAVAVTITPTADGGFTVTSADTGAVIATVQSGFLASFLSQY